jgi:hypothetical protein
MTAIVGQAFRTEDNGSVPWNGLPTELVERTPEKKANPKPTIKQNTALKPFIRCLRSSRLGLRSMRFPVMLNNAD